MWKAVVAGIAVLGAGWFAMQGATGRGARWDEKRDNVQLAPTGDPALERARAKARSGLDGFLARADRPGPQDRNFGVKIALKGDGHVEHVWIASFRRQGDGFVGRLDNEPRFVKSYKSGQTLTFARGEIEDWMYRDGSVMRGNFTACALLANKPADRERAEKQFGLRCEA
jgi:uncharacterized protein YegJ (DUF2314 family)